jgi:hypothetical protein
MLEFCASSFVERDRPLVRCVLRALWQRMSADERDAIGEWLHDCYAVADLSEREAIATALIQLETWDMHVKV